MEANKTENSNYSIMENQTPASIKYLTTIHQQKYDLFKVIEYKFTWIYIAPIILILGIVGNMLTTMVMSRRRMRYSTTAVYLIILAISDTLALLFRVPPEFAKEINLGKFSEYSLFACRFEKFSFYTTSDIAIWILVLFSIDRFIAVSFPLNKKQLCRPKRALLACLIISVICVGKNLHVFWTRGIEYKKGKVYKICGRPDRYRDFEEHIRPKIAMAFVNIIPFVVILICNLVIIKLLIKVSRNFREKVNINAASRHKLSRSDSKQNKINILIIDDSITNQSHSQIVGEGNSHFETNKSTNKPNNLSASNNKKMSNLNTSPRGFTQTTLMCISTSIAFLLLVTPSIIIVVGRVYWLSEEKNVIPYSITRAISYQLSILNHAINFFLYCITGERFRREILTMFNCNKKNSSYGSTRKYSVQTSKLSSIGKSNSLIYKGASSGSKSPKCSIVLSSNSFNLNARIENDLKRSPNEENKKMELLTEEF